jgi:hypothetical protein
LPGGRPPPVDAKGNPYTARDIHNAIPVATRGGYQLAGDPTSDGPRWIRGADGRPFVLDIERMERSCGSAFPACIGASDVRREE